MTLLIKTHNCGINNYPVSFKGNRSKASIILLENFSVEDQTRLLTSEYYRHAVLYKAYLYI